MYDYRYNRQLVPVRPQGDARTLGTAGHLLLACYYRARMSGSSHTEAQQQAENFADYEAAVAGIEPSIMAEALSCCRTYWAFYPSDDWTILAVEAEYRHGPFACTVDLIVEEQGEIAIVDHRFLARPYDESLAVLDPQPVRYADILRRNGVPVQRAYRNMISTATSKAQRHKISRLPLPLTPARFERVGADVTPTLLRVQQLRSGMHPLRTWNAQVCKSCDYLVPCSLDAEGQSDETYLALNYKRSTRYGYTELPPAE